MAYPRNLRPNVWGVGQLWQQAAAQGITVLVSSGDSGAAGCDGSSATIATHGTGINGLCSSTYGVCVGGTQFNDTASPSLYWSPSNAAGTQASTLSYIPEKVWNESGPSGLWSTGGGASTVYTKPTWQVGAGVPADKKRDVPDVSLAAAGHDGYLIYMNGSLGAVGGTSAASPAFAGLMALVVQNSGVRQGNPNPTFYSIATRQAAGGAAIFHDIVAGNNSVPGLAGFCGHWLRFGNRPGFGGCNHAGDALGGRNIGSRISGGGRCQFPAGAGGQRRCGLLYVQHQRRFQRTNFFFNDRASRGLIGDIRTHQLCRPGFAERHVNHQCQLGTRAGSYLANVVATSGGLTRTVALTVTITPAPDYTLTLSTTSVSVAPGKTGSVNATTSVNTGFNAPINVSVSGLPSGVTASSSRPTIPAPGSGVNTLTFSIAKTTAPGNYSLMVTAAGGGIVHPQSLAFNIPGFTLTSGHATASLATGAQSSIILTTRAVGGFTSPIRLSVSGQPAGVTVTLSPQMNGASTLTNTRGSTAKVSNFKLTITATGGGPTKTTMIGLTVKP